MDVKVSIPRNSKSPNYKIDRSIKTLTSSPTSKFDQFKSPEKAEQFDFSDYLNLQAPSIVSENTALRMEKPHYLQLSQFCQRQRAGYSNSGLGINPASRNSLKRFSQELTFGVHYQDFLETHKKRFSLEESRRIAFPFSQYE